MSFSDWTLDSVTAEPTIIEVNYTGADGQAKSVSLVSTTTSETKSNYRDIYYTTVDGARDYESVASDRSSTTRSTAAAVNGALVTWRLSNGQGLPSGDASRESFTTYSYAIGDNGPYVSREVTLEYISEYELAGSLNITDYTGFSPTSALLLSGKTITDYTESIGGNGRTYTKTVTTRYMALGLTQEGQQSAAEQLAQDAGNGAVTSSVFYAMQELVCDGAEVRNSIGRAPTPARPSGQQLIKDFIDNDYSEDNGWTVDNGTGSINNSAERTVEIIFRYTPGSETTVSRIDSYSLPYSPDSTYTGSFSFPAGSQVTWNGVRSLFTGAANAARNYGLMMNALNAGYAYGFNITTSCDRLPTTPFAPLYINAAGLSVAVRLNGVSWAFDGSGLVASTDLMLCGVAGAIGSVTSSWVRLPVAAENLPILSPPTENTTPTPGSTITAPPGFDPTNPGDVFSGLPADNNDTPGAVQNPGGVVPPFLVDEELIGRSRHLAVISELTYEVQPVAEEAVLITKHRATADVQLTLEIPVATLALAAYAPAATAGAALQVPAAILVLATYPPATATGTAALAPAAVLTLAAHAPAIATGASVVVPAAGLALTAVAPDTAGPAGARLEPPAAALSLAAHTPAVATGASVAASAAVLTLTAHTPAVSTGASVAVPAAALTLSAQAPDVTIVVPPSFKAVTYTGTGDTLSITGVGFKPGIVFTRRRGASPGDGAVFDYSRTVNKYWLSTTNAAEQTSATQLTSLDADGFTLGAGAITNLNGSTNVAWCWKEGAAAATDTSGTIGSTVYANTGGGFSVIRYTGNGTAGASIGHGLGAAPDLVLIKALDAADYTYVGGAAAGANNYMLLSLNQQLLADNRFLRTFSSSTITLGSGGGVNTNGTDYIAYAFASKAGVSKAGTYTGGGATAVTVDCGFAPDLLLVKSTGTGNWMWFDTARGETKQLLQSSGAETTVDKVTLGASGFTAKANADTNTASTSFIYLAFA